MLQRLTSQSREALTIVSPLSKQAIDIRQALGMIFSNGSIATAKSAESFTKRNVQIERPARTLLIEAGTNAFDPLRLGRSFFPIWHGWIACIARHRHIIFFQKISHEKFSRTISIRRFTLRSGVAGNTP